MIKDPKERSIPFRVGDVIYQKGFIPAKPLERESPWEIDRLGILSNPSDEGRKIFKIIRLRPKRDLVGVIHIDSSDLFVLEVYGRKYLKQAIDMANKIYKGVGVPVSIRLIQEDVKKESYFLRLRHLSKS